ncbi:PIG-L family deacetylase [Actinocrispum sp. NPDC049592]|uniref:PIG-L family deacetylase n=1 Tax=Actinocrispum sp. NPDC049592 TaxID=3154835 RepID=UPI00344A4627
MATLVTFHAHPDDECITCGGVMRKAYEDGHRVVLVVATKGERGEVPDWLTGEELWELRVRETHAAAKVLGVSRVEFLGYKDSGMMGWDSNTEPGSFWSADVEEAAGKLAAILREENADVLTIYDDNGTYGHPDHIQVHRVGKRAGEIAGTPRVFQQTANRTLAQANPNAPDIVKDPNFGKPDELLTARVDVSEYVSYKREAMRAHASQIAEDSWFLAAPDEIFRDIFGTEWFMRAGQGPGITETDIMGGLPT